MDIAEITKLVGSRVGCKRIGRGRGSRQGKTCGRGNKGAGQRAGNRKRSLQEGGQMPTFRRLPKRGFNNARFTTRYEVVNVGLLETRYEAGAHVTLQSLREVGLIGTLRLPVKILGEGTLTKKLTVDAAKFSKSAVEKILATGGEAKVAS